jgi:hypothetical protein
MIELRADGGCGGAGNSGMGLFVLPLQSLPSDQADHPHDRSAE